MLNQIWLLVFVALDFRSNYNHTGLVLITNSLAWKYCRNRNFLTGANNYKGSDSCSIQTWIWLACASGVYTAASVQTFVSCRVGSAFPAGSSGFDKADIRRLKWLLKDVNGDLMFTYCRLARPKHYWRRWDSDDIFVEARHWMKKQVGVWSFQSQNKVGLAACYQNTSTIQNINWIWELVEDKAGRDIRGSGLITNSLGKCVWM
jgi:hypothetical protein